MESVFVLYVSCMGQFTHIKDTAPHVPLFLSYLSFPVDADDAGGGLVGRGDEDGLAADAVHVDAGSRLQVVQVDVAVLGDEEHHVLLGADLWRDHQREEREERMDG